jgi:hypothetical protein
MSISSSALLVELNISTWTARKLDRKTSAEVDTAKSTKVKAGNYHKKLLAGTKELEAVQQVASRIRTWHASMTLPWGKNGTCLLPMDNFFQYKQELNAHEQDFDAAVAAFLAAYPTLVTAMAFQLGALFTRAEYPDVKDIAGKFRLRYSFSPVPEVGDFRIDTEAQTKRELEEQYQAVYQEKLADAQKELWDSLHEHLTHMSERLTAADDGSKKIFHDSLVENAIKLCSRLSRLNVTNDPALEQARRSLESALVGVDAKELRKHDDARVEVKSRVDEILSKFPI